MPANVFVDSNIWLYAFVQNPLDTRRQRAATFVLELDGPVISSQVVRETCFNLVKKSGRTKPELQLLVTDWLSTCEVIHSNVVQHVLASQLRQDGGFSYWDSLIVASALDAGCTTLYSEGMQHGRGLRGQLTILNPLQA
ncbi:MAG: PIN domain-containing protein [Rhodoferax sp.]|nr:PIN domain-containing protein [Rhodoferax sp.]